MKIGIAVDHGGYLLDGVEATGTKGNAYA